MPPRVVFDGVWKKFRRGERHDSLRDLVPAAIKRLARGRPPGLDAQEFWAVEDVSFSVDAGKALGIIGGNGAGKSTTLKLLTKILRPNLGACRVTGRVGALIEVAAGFHPDLTGRENVYLQGAIMGMSRREVQARFDDIVEFAGVGAFIDTQTKRYSSGMNARLGFSIAAHLSPDALIIDEVLSVGDIGFQQRCVDRMFEFKRQGVAIVFVSHNLQAIAALCDQVLVLQRKPLFLGATAHGISAYVQSIEGRQDQGGRVNIEARLVRPDGTPVSVAEPGAALRLSVTYAANTPVADFLVSFRLVRTADQFLVYDGHFTAAELGKTGLAAGDVLRVDFDFYAHLTRGQFHLETHLSEVESQTYVAWLRPAGLLTIDEHRTWGGVADLGVRARTAAAAPADSTV